MQEKYAVIIREARYEDLTQVVEINRICLPENYPYYFFQHILERFPKAFIVAEVNGEVVGYMMNRIEKGMSSFNPSPFKLLKKGHVVSIAVLPAYRRMGIGKKLMERGLKAMREYGAEEVILEVRVSNDPAIKLYTLMGFTIVKTLKGYYHDGEDAFLMCKKLVDAM
ncbi:MAG: ribosomal protein S18-alanine N-acetyltransferase [Candidatus Freyarchaeota archaeon]|nr:ribosomal protein S18-alanine N-acetyltransferase [Candidatus Freyrarchaeum guaymaensis]